MAISRPNEAIQPSDPLDGVYILGKKARTSVTNKIISATYDTSTSATSQITIAFFDPGFVDTRKGLYSLHTPVLFEDWRLQIAKQDISEQAGKPVVTVQCRADIVRKLKNRKGKRVMHNASPTDFVKAECAAVGVKVFAQASKKRPNIARDVKGPGDGENDTDQVTEYNSWTTFQRLASEVGFICFESAGAVYFGKPTWLLNRSKSTAVHVVWDGDGGVRPQNIPVVSKSLDSKVTNVSVSVPVKYAAQVKVGGAIHLSGVPGYQGWYLITSLNYSLMNTAFVSVTAQTPIDPAATGWAKPTQGASAKAASDPDYVANLSSGASGRGSASAFVQVALGQAGDPYVWGAEASKGDPNPRAFDCSELVEWAAGRVGVYIPDGSSAQIAFCRKISVSSAIRTRGALLHKPGHIAISLGNGRTIEAVGTGYGVRTMSATSRSFNWSSGGLIPGMRY
jgi:cell wall-associated NlpC family hydrolase